MALNYLVDHLPELSGLAAETERLDALITALQVQQAQQLEIKRYPDLQGGLQLDSLTVRTPSGQRMMCQLLDVRLEERQSLLIVGPSGCGKSSMLRAISGLWTSGSGSVLTPPEHTLFFLPQKPFMPLGNLREQLLFPSGSWSGGQGNRPDVLASDTQLLDLLEDVSLPGLAERVGGLDAELEWAHVLSLGEQQRVAFLRLLLHRPQLAFLDEATGALDTPTEATLYRLLQRQCPSYVSVGHRKELQAYHTHALVHTGKAGWELLSMDMLRRRLSAS